MAEKRATSKNQLRNLPQYRDMSERDFDLMFEQREYGINLSKDFEERISKKLEEFSRDYDIDDLKINDKDTLRSFIQTMIALEDYEQLVFEIRTENEVSQGNIQVLEKLSKMMSDLKKDASRFQEDLNITRKIRKSDKESSVVSYIANLKDQARQYYESKMSYVFCPSCNMMLGNVWALYPEADNKMTFKCQRVLGDGSKCDTKVVVTTKELMDNRGTNKPSVTPDSLL